MKTELIDITGNVYNHLTVIGFSHIGNRRRSYWVCQCDCGNTKVLRKDSFIYKYSQAKSCGCHKKDVDTKRMIKRNAENNPMLDDAIRQKHSVFMKQNPQATDIKTGKYINNKEKQTNGNLC